MQTSSRFLAFVVLGGSVALAACGASPDASPVASTTTSLIDGGTVTSSGNGPGGQPSPAPGTGTCTNDCDGTGQGPGPGAGSGYGPGAANGGGTGNGYGPGPGPSDGFCGNACTGPVGPDPADIAVMLGETLQEEYKAQYLYASVLEDYPGALPFAAIVEAEMRHVEALQMLFTRRQMMPPSSAWTPGMFDAFASLPAACAGGVDAEMADAAFYTPYLSRTDLPQDVRERLHEPAGRFAREPPPGLSALPVGDIMTTNAPARFHWRAFVTLYCDAVLPVARGLGDRALRRPPGPGRELVSLDAGLARPLGLAIPPHGLRTALRAGGGVPPLVQLACRGFEASAGTLMKDLAERLGSRPHDLVEILAGA